jgi:1,4-dihydroxy-2-naphthoyl-CoA hydrolase
VTRATTPLPDGPHPRMTVLTLDWLNTAPGWGSAMNIVFTAASADEVRCEMVVDARHLQPFGLVHGGVYCGTIEQATSIGATLHVSAIGQQAVGLENTTSFIRAVKEGTLYTVARPIQRGRTNQLWEAWIRDERDRLVSQGRVRLQNIAHVAAT